MGGGRGRVMRQGKKMEWDRDGEGGVLCGA